MGAEPRVLNYYIGEDAPRGVYTIRYLRHDPCIRDSTPTDYELTVTLDGLSYTVTGTIGVGEHLGWRYGDDPIAQSFHRFEY